jgi:hypothetical protein
MSKVILAHQKRGQTIRVSGPSCISQRSQLNSANQRHFLNVIKYLGNELQIPIVAAGTHDAFNAVQSDPQLSNRFEPALLRRWALTDEYLRLLASFEVALPLERYRAKQQTIEPPKQAPAGEAAESNRPAHRGISPSVGYRGTVWRSPPKRPPSL